MNRVKKIRIVFFISVLVLYLTGCSVVRPEKIIYDPDTRLYKYPLGTNEMIYLRNDEGKLVTRENFQEFIMELAGRNYYYPFDQYVEKDEFLREKDKKLVTLYSQAVQEINDSNFVSAAEYLDKLQGTYPQAAWYTDMAFLEGYAREKAGDTTLAALHYNDFLNYSEGKYSDRFRGHTYKDPLNATWGLEREYARSYLANQPAEATTNFFSPIEPQFYFNSLQPGYTLNDEALALNPNGHLFLTVGSIVSTDFGVGLQYYRSLNRTFDINPGFIYSSDNWSINLAVPIQLYRSDNNRMGLKFSPFAHYTKFTDDQWDGTGWVRDEGVFNGGFKASAGFYLMQRLSLGAWYTWYYYNENRPYTFSASRSQFWWNNEYDVSLYVNLLKGLSLKGGLRTGDPVAGIFYNGTEISFNFETREIIWRSDLY